MGVILFSVVIGLLLGRMLGVESIRLLVCRIAYVYACVTVFAQALKGARTGVVNSFALAVNAMLLLLTILAVRTLFSLSHPPTHTHTHICTHRMLGLTCFLCSS